MKKRFMLGVVIFGAAAAAGLLFASAAQHTDSASLPTHVADAANGEVLYHIGGCISCHHPPKDSGADMALPSGGTPFLTPIGTLYPPNITPDAATGIGAWSDAAFVDAVQHGVSPTGEHLIPAFPYISYGRMKVEDCDQAAEFFSGMILGHNQIRSLLRLPSDKTAEEFGRFAREAAERFMRAYAP